MNRIILILILVGISIYLYYNLFKLDYFGNKNVQPQPKLNKNIKQNNRHVHFAPNEIILGPSNRSNHEIDHEHYHEQHAPQHAQHAQHAPQPQHVQQHVPQPQHVQQHVPQPQHVQHVQHVTPHVQQHVPQPVEHASYQSSQLQHIQNNQWDDTFNNSMQSSNINNELINTDNFIDDIFIKPIEINNTNLTLSENEYFNY